MARSETCEERGKLVFAGFDPSRTSGIEALKTGGFDPSRTSGIEKSTTAQRGLF